MKHNFLFKNITILKFFVRSVFLVHIVMKNLPSFPFLFSLVPSNKPMPQLLVSSLVRKVESKLLVNQRSVNWPSVHAVIEKC